MTLQTVDNETQEFTIPVDIFVSPNPSHPIVQGMFRHEAGKITFKSFVALMGYPSLRRLSKLLGCADSVYVYRWNSGTYRPSQLYLGRMIYLIKLKFIDGVKLENINHINWTTGEQKRNDYRDYKPTIRPDLRTRSIEERQPLGITRLSEESEPFLKPIAKPSIWSEQTQIFENN